MDTTAAAAEANVTTATIRTWCRTGVIAAVKTAGRWIIDTASLAHRLAIGAMKTPRKAPKPVVFTVETITAIGGRRWQKNGMDRVYLNNWEDFAGLEITRYGSGRVSSASLPGGAIANGRVHGILDAIEKVYFDTADGLLHFQHRRADSYEIRYLDGRRDHLNLIAMTTAGVRAAIAAL